MVARYDAIADFYASQWTDACDDSVSVAVFELLGDVERRRVLDLACGHGRIARQLARRGATVIGLDISDALLDRARSLEQELRLGVTYVLGDASGHVLSDEVFDKVVCNFGLSDIDDLAGTVATVNRVLGRGGEFVWSTLHPCFPGAGEVSGSWPSGGSYFDERRWVTESKASRLRRKVGSNHRMLSTYLNCFQNHGLSLDTVIEPEPGDEWVVERPDSAHLPVFIVGRCLKR